MTYTPTRTDDEAVLRCIELRIEGYTSPQIAAAVGVTASNIRTATNRVLDADLDESGEDRAVVLAANWRRQAVAA